MPTVSNGIVRWASHSVMILHVMHACEMLCIGETDPLPTFWLKNSFLTDFYRENAPQKGYQNLVQFLHFSPQIFFISPTRGNNCCFSFERGPKFKLV